MKSAGMGCKIHAFCYLPPELRLCYIIEKPIIKYPAMNNHISYEPVDDLIPEIKTVDDLHRYIESLRDRIPDRALLKEIQVQEQ